MIIETIVTTADAGSRVNIAPMGPWVDGPRCRRWTLRPFVNTTTFRNLQATGRAVIHVTDDSRLFARAAVGHVDPEGLVEPIDGGWWRLRDCHRWFAVTVDTRLSMEVPNAAGRVELPVEVVRDGTVRPFVGFNRARHAVLEAAILATRTHLLAAGEIQDQLARLRPLIDKTAGPDEHEAFEFLCQFINQNTPTSTADPA